MDGRRAGPIDRGVSKDFLKVLMPLQVKMSIHSDAFNLGCREGCPKQVPFDGHEPEFRESEWPGEDWHVLILQFNRVSLRFVDLRNITSSTLLCAVTVSDILNNFV